MSERPEERGRIEYAPVIVSGAHGRDIVVQVPVSVGPSDEVLAQVQGELALAVARPVGEGCRGRLVVTDRGWAHGGGSGGGR